MATQQFHAQAHLQEGTRVDVTSRHFSLTIDEPKELGGTDTGINPVETVLGALGACQSIVARVYAKQFDVELEDFWVDIAGDLDPDGFLGKAPVRPGYSEIRYDFHIQSPSPQANIDRLIEHLQQFCPVGDTINNPVALKLGNVIVNQQAA